MTNKIIIGCDPDSANSGFCIIKNGELKEIKSMCVIGFYLYLQSNSLEVATLDNVELHIENVKGNRCSSFNWKPTDSKGVRAKKSENVGMCKQAQSEVERVAKYFGIKVIHHPVSKMWKDSKTGKQQLEKVFDYTGQSNEDTRSAAWFAYKGLQHSKT